MVYYTLVSKSNAFNTIIDFENKVKRHFGLTIYKIRMDNDRALIFSDKERETLFERWIRDEGIDIELGPPYIKGPTGGAKRSGGVI